jgi:protein-disulfide isomerase
VSEAVTAADRRFRFRMLLDLVATLVMIAAGAVVLWQALLHKPPVAHPLGLHLTTNRVSLAGAQVLGSGAAPAVMIEFSDFECPYCGQFARDVFPAIRAQYVATGRIRFAFRYLPLRIHPFAAAAAISAECAGSQDEFWRMHDLLFARPIDLSHSAIIQKAKSLSLQPGVFLRCLDDPRITAKVRADASSATKLGVSSTPSFIFGIADKDSEIVQVTEAVTGVGTIRDVKQLLDDLTSRSSNISTSEAR